MLTHLKHLVKWCAGLVGAAVVSRESITYWERQSLAGVVGQIAKLDIEIGTVIDIGAAHGDWSLACSTLLPDARYALFEPLTEYQAALKLSTAQIPNSEFHITGIGLKRGSQRIHVHPDLVGSSFYLEREDSDVNGEARTVPVTTLDEIRAALNLPPPYLLKIDVQGAEADVLSGASSTLQHCAFVICECSLFNFYDGGATIEDVIDIMRDSGFALYDIFGLSHRPVDDALAQADLCFVKNEGPFRTTHFFATREQRQAVTARLSKRSTPRAARKSR